MHWMLIVFFVAFLCWISVTDICRQVIPNKAIATAIIVRIMSTLWLEKLEWQGIVIIFLNGIAIAGPLLLLICIVEKLKKQEVMGGGDIKLLFVIGLYIGWEKSLMACFIACVLGIIIGLIQRTRENMYFPFGPSIAVGAIVAMLIG